MTSAAALPAVDQAPGKNPVDRLRSAAAGVGAGVLGAAPHVLHHVGPLAGAAIVAGATGRLVFGAIGFLAAVPLLRKVRRRTGSWRAPGMLLALMAAVFTFSSFVIGPALTGSDDEAARPAQPGTTQPAPDEHDSHHP